VEQMAQEQILVKKLNFQLNIQSDNESLLEDATLESLWVYNETIRLAK
jgi:putative transposase